MDAVDDHKDAKLYRASSDLLPELEAKLPQLVWKHHNDKLSKEPRQRVLWIKFAEVIEILERFQEWPQLLDSRLAFLVETLADSFLSYLRIPENFRIKNSQEIVNQGWPLPRVICHTLYVLCKVRGYKVIVRLLNNEPRIIEPLLEYFVIQRKAKSQPWEERYVLLLWLSHLMLAPFDLALISSAPMVQSSPHSAELVAGLPSVAADLLTLGLEYLNVPGREMEAATILIARLTLRTDMQKKSLLQAVIGFAISGLRREEIDTGKSVYQHVGLLSLLANVMKTASDHDINSAIVPVFDACLHTATGDSLRAISIRDSAPARTLLIKSMRATITHAISINSTQNEPFHVLDLDFMLEASIQHFLDALSDKDTPVRMAASKNLSVIALKLDTSMAAEVTQAVLESLNENMLLEDPATFRIFAATDAIAAHEKFYQRNLSAVDPLKWQGLMLTLGHLLFRRSPPPDQLAEIIRALLLGLDFEQRSNVGTSVGVSVRDAACFGVWCLVRKYSTGELVYTDLPETKALNDIESLPEHRHNLQLIATKLVVSACFDPSGNIRRGASAALQELIGRHPDTVLNGIALVQAVDYHAVALRSRAMIEVAGAAVKLGRVYHQLLLHELLGWRGARAADPDSRRSAAEAFGVLVRNSPTAERAVLSITIAEQIKSLKAANSGVNAGTRHGLIISLASILTSMAQEDEGLTTVQERELMKSISLSLWGDSHDFLGNLDGRMTRDLEFVLEAASSLISSMAALHLYLHAATIDKVPPPKLDVVVRILERCLTGSEKENVVLLATKAAVGLLSILHNRKRANIATEWLRSDQKRPDYRSRGRIEVLGSVFILLPKSENDLLRRDILAHLTDLIKGPWPIETKVYAMKSLKIIFVSIATLPKELNGSREEILTTVNEVNSVTAAILLGLQNYTIDQRGDIGSTLRLESVAVVMSLLNIEHLEEESRSGLRILIREVGKLAGERLNKVRFEAWKCLEYYCRTDTGIPELNVIFSHITDISSTAYYRQLMRLLDTDWLREHVLTGIISSAGAGTEEIGRASRDAVAAYYMEQNSVDRSRTANFFLKYMSDFLKNHATGEDRAVLPTMDFLAFLIEQRFLDEALMGPGEGDVEIWVSIQHVHSPTSSLQRAEAAIKVYAALCACEAYRKRALERLSRLLLHRYPIIRNAAADAITTQTEVPSLLACDLTAPVAEIKPVVVALRRHLGIAAAASTRPIALQAMR